MLPTHRLYMSFLDINQISQSLVQVTSLLFWPVIVILGENVWNIIPFESGSPFNDALRIKKVNVLCEW